MVAAVGDELDQQEDDDDEDQKPHDEPHAEEHDGPSGRLPSFLE